MPVQIYLYIIRLRNSMYYCGITNDIERRLKEHSKKGKSWASKVGIIKVEYISKFDERKQAAKMERKIKIYGVSKFMKYLRVHNKVKF